MTKCDFYLLTLAMFALSVTICEVFTVEMCMTNVKCKYDKGKATCDFLSEMCR